MSDKKDIDRLWARLQDTSKWYIETSSHEEPELADIVEKAKDNADYGLSHISTRALYTRYLRWKKEERELTPILYDNVFEPFLNEMAFSIGMSSLDGTERLI